MKIALTGSDGMLGHDIQKVFTDVELINFRLKDFDITDPDSTSSAIKEARPDYLIHSAAYTDVEGCEKDPLSDCVHCELCYLCNGSSIDRFTQRSIWQNVVRYQFLASSKSG